MQGAEAMQKAKRAHHAPAMSISRFDLVTALRSLSNSFTGKMKFSHISGHQDRCDEEISHKEKLNKIANTRAKVALWEYAVSAKPTLDFIGNKNILGGLKMQSKHLTVGIVSNLRKSLPDNIVQIRAIEHWVAKGKEFIVNKEADLNTFHHTSRNIPINLNRWLPKSCGMHGVGK